MEYEEFKKKSRLETANVWQHFLRAKDGQTAKCKICNRILKAVGGSTTGLHVHLKSAHSITFAKNPVSTSTTTTPTTSNNQGQAVSDVDHKKQKLTDYFTSSNSMETMVSRMTALDGLTFRVFCTSFDLKQLFLKYGHTLPQNPTTIKNMVIKYKDKVKTELVRELKSLMEKGHKFSLTFDEWSSVRNRRYMNINIHSVGFTDVSRFKNLGLVRIVGSMPSDVCIVQLKQRLSEFGISLKNDIVAITTDGASVMRKVGRSLPALHQLCLAHGIQLAVVDVFYNKHPEVNTTETAEQSTEELESDESDTETEDDTEYAFDVSVEESSKRNRHYNTTTFANVIQKVRKVVKLFKNSPTKNDDNLQSQLQKDIGKELALIIDCKTRWSSIANMLGRFLEIKSSVFKALIDVNSKIQFTAEEIQMLEDIYNCLHLCATSIEAICRRDATLLTAETTLKFLMKKLTEKNSHISSMLINALEKRIEERRLTAATGVLRYIHNPATYMKDANSYSPLFPLLSCEELVSTIATLYNRLNSTEAAESRGTTSVAVMEELMETATKSSAAVLTLQEELNRELNADQEQIKINHVREDEQDLKNRVRVEMALFESGGDRGHILTAVHKYLLSVPPTSVESERAFSAAGYICTKIRSRLGDDSIDALCFLRSHFQRLRY